MTNLQYYTQLVYYGTKLLPDIDKVRDIVISILLEEEDINILYLTVRNMCIEAGGEDKELNIEYELIEVAMLEELSKQNNMLSEQLKDHISNEGEAISAKFKDTNDYLAGRIQGFNDGYEAGGYKYAEKWQEAEQRAVTMAEVIEELMNIAYPNVPVLKKANQVLADYNTHKQSLTPKTSTDDTDNG